MLKNRLIRFIVAAAIVLPLLFLTVAAGKADEVAPEIPAAECQDCHEIVQMHWAESAHGNSVTNTNFDLMVGALNSAHGTALESAFLRQLGLETLRLEWRFNKEAGFTERDDELPEFFYTEPLPPHNVVFDFSGEEIDTFWNF